jgi:hypothetical protein
MKDIDFDELDRAVNSLISGDGKPGSAVVGTTAPVAAAPVTSSEIASPEVALAPAEPVAAPVVPVSAPTINSAPVAAPAVTPVADVQPLAARRTSGRFMDVVHPSSDMRPNSVPVTAPKPLPATTLLSTPIVPAVTPIAPPVVAPAPEPATPEVPTLEPVPAGGARDWPDPIDFQAATTATASTAPIINATPTSSVVPAVSSSESTPAVQPLVSPFLSDAKVEKRPLGAFSATDSEPTPTPPAEPESDAPTSPIVGKEDNPIGQETPMPAELQDDLLHIESDSESTAPSNSPDLALTGPTSITQQYKETLSAPQTSGAIFDTNSYHKPLAHPAKKKSSVKVIIWIVALLIVGGGIGAAIYFLVLPKV